MTTSTESPVVIGPPLVGADWLAASGCFEMGRKVMLPIGGSINGAERFAVDWMKLDMTLDPAAQAALGRRGVIDVPRVGCDGGSRNDGRMHHPTAAPVHGLTPGLSALIAGFGSLRHAGTDAGSVGLANAIVRWAMYFAPQ